MNPQPGSDRSVSPRARVPLLPTLGILLAVVVGVAARPLADDLQRRVELLEKKVAELQGLEPRVQRLEQAVGITRAETPSAAAPAEATEATRRAVSIQLPDPTLARRPNDPGPAEVRPPARIWLAATSDRGIKAEVTEISHGPVLVKKNFLSDELEPTPDRWLLIRVVYTNTSPSWLWNPHRYVPGLFASCNHQELRKWTEVKGGPANLDPGYLGATRRIPEVLRWGDSITMVEVFELPPDQAAEVDLRAAVGDPWDLHRTIPFLTGKVEVTAIPAR